MPFKSAAQRRFLFSEKPEVAKKFTNDTHKLATTMAASSPRGLIKTPHVESPMQTMRPKY